MSGEGRAFAGMSLGSLIGQEPVLGATHLDEPPQPGRRGSDRLRLTVRAPG
jgi:hypothetical protein